MSERKQLAQAASKEKSKKWFCRVDGTKDFLREKCKQMSGWVDVVSMLAAFHMGERKENPHAHFVVETTSEIQKQSFAIRIKALFAVEKKTQYALAVWDGDRGVGAVSYLFHEDDVEILVNRGFSDGDIERAREANRAVQRVVAVNKEKASNKLAEKAYERFKSDDGFSRVACLAYMLGEIKAGENYHPGEFMLKRYVEEVEVRLTDDITGLAWEIANRLWRN